MSAQPVEPITGTMTPTGTPATSAQNEETMNGNGFSLNTTWGSIKATGPITVAVLCTFAIMGTILWQAAAQEEQHRDLSKKTADLITSMDDVFLSQMLTPEQKQDLPAYLKEKVRQKVNRRAVEIVEQEEEPHGDTANRTGGRAHRRPGER